MSKRKPNYKIIRKNISIEFDQALYFWKQAIIYNFRRPSLDQFIKASEILYIAKGFGPAENPNYYQEAHDRINEILSEENEPSTFNFDEFYSNIEPYIYIYITPIEYLTAEQQVELAKGLF